MSENAAKLNKLRKEIEACSEKEAESIIESAQRTADDAISATEKEMRGTQKDNSRRTVEKFRLSERRRVSEVRFSEGKRVLLYRAELVDGFFARVAAELKEQTKTNRYKDYLARSIAQAEEHYSLEAAEICCREEDIAVVGSLISEKGIKVIASDSIEIGGITIKIPEKRIILDLSLDAALEKERESFSALAEMQV